MLPGPTFVFRRRTKESQVQWMEIVSPPLSTVRSSSDSFRPPYYDMAALNSGLGDIVPALLSRFTLGGFSIDQGSRTVVHAYLIPTPCTSYVLEVCTTSSRSEPDSSPLDAIDIHCSLQVRQRIVERLISS